MLKILYAAGNNSESKIQLARFLQAIEGLPYKIKIAAYKASSPKNTLIDWTLDCLLNIFDPFKINANNSNFKIYYEQVKYFAPDLIISDLEYFTSYIASTLNVKMWNCSSSLINYGVTDKSKHDVGLKKYYKNLFVNFIFSKDKINNIIFNTNRNLVYSHLGDIEDGPELIDKFEWVRPYYPEGKISIPCQRNIIGISSSNNKKILSLIKNYPDSVMFSNFKKETYKNVIMKDISSIDEYACNLRNSNLLICEGQTSFLADAYYNNKYSIVFPDLQELECIVNSFFSKKSKLSHIVYNANENFDEYMNQTIVSNKKNNIKFLHEKLLEL